MNWGAAAAVILALGCAREPTKVAESALHLMVVSGDGQEAPAGGQFALPLVARVLRVDANIGVAGVRVRFEAVPGSHAVLVDTIAVSDAQGRVEARARVADLAMAGETIGISARIVAAPHQEVRFTGTAREGARVVAVIPFSLKAGDTVDVVGVGFTGSRVRVKFGDVAVDAIAALTTSAHARAVVPRCLKPGKTDVSVEVDGQLTNSASSTIVSVRETLALAPNERATISSAQLEECVVLPGGGATYLVVGQFATAGPPDSIRWQLGNSSSVVASARAMAPASARPLPAATARHEFDAGLRGLEQTLLPELRAQARPRLARLADPPTIGSVRSFEVTTKLDGSAYATIAARLRYAGDNLLVYTDTSDNGPSAAQLQALARLFDLELVREAERVFGALPDVDGDGRVTVLFTPSVNRLQRREDCVLRGYPTGYFFPVDQLERAAHSNRGEIFYAFVPDSIDRYSCTHREEDVVRMIQATFLHELQHLISFNQRVLARGATFEDGWLNEGLSQIAEELGSRIFERRYPAPLGRSSTTQLFPDSAAPFIAPQMLNAYVYLYFQLQHSLTSFAGAGSLEERGAAWLFLRWLADQKGEAVFARLVQSSRRGIANIESVTGEPFGELFGDFSLALFADSLPGLPRATSASRLRYTTRNIRQLMAREAVISGFGETFPIATYQLSRNGALRAAMPRGTMIHAILQSKPDDGPVRLSFRTFVGAPFEASAGAQVSILRLP